MFVFLHHSAHFDVLRVSTDSMIDPKWDCSTEDDDLRSCLRRFDDRLFAPHSDGWMKPIWSGYFQASGFSLPGSLHALLNGRAQQVTTLVFLSDTHPNVETDASAWRNSTPLLHRIFLSGVRLNGAYASKIDWPAKVVELEGVENAHLFDWGTAESLTMYPCELYSIDIDRDTCKEIMLRRCPFLTGTSVFDSLFSRGLSLRTCRIIGAANSYECAVAMSDCFPVMTHLIDVALDDFSRDIAQKLYDSVSHRLKRLEIMRVTGPCSLDTDLFPEMTDLILHDFPCDHLFGRASSLKYLQLGSDRSPSNAGLNQFLSKTYHRLDTISLGPSVLARPPPSNIFGMKTNKLRVLRDTGTLTSDWIRWIHAEKTNRVTLDTYHAVRVLSDNVVGKFWMVDELVIETVDATEQESFAIIKTLESLVFSLFPYVRQITLNNPKTADVPATITVDWNTLKLFCRYDISGLM